MQRRHECKTTQTTSIILENNPCIFSYTKCPVKKNKYWEIFKIIRKLLFLFLISITS